MAGKLMTKEELIQFLKDNLKICIEEDRGWNYYATSITHTLHLKLGDDVISTDYISIPVHND